MKYIRIGIAVILLILLSANFFADLKMSLDEFSCAHGSCRLSSDKDVLEADLYSRNPQSEETCNDACHAGFCHFGHCFATFPTLAIKIQVLTQHLDILSRDSMTEGPYLEGLKRPPRFS